jgi:hypothetical protein
VVTLVRNTQVHRYVECLVVVEIEGKVNYDELGVTEQRMAELKGVRVYLSGIRFWVEVPKSRTFVSAL